MRGGDNARRSLQDVASGWATLRNLDIRDFGAVRLEAFAGLLRFDRIALESDIHKMEDVTTRGASGISTGGKPVILTAGQIRQTSLIVAVPASQESILLSETFREVIGRFEETYKTTIEVIPVEGW